MRTAGPLVIALGGNAISRPDEEGNIEQQFRNTRQTCILLADLIEAGCQLVITHGNGPQVGNVLRRVELASSEVYPLPLDICVSDTQGGMGYMIAQCLRNELQRRGRDREVGVIITCVEVDPNDPDFQNPSKPIGVRYTPERAAELQREHGWRMVQVADGRYRRVVPSPVPRRILEIELIRKLVASGELLVAAGGGGIPVARLPSGDYVGVEAVIDKDRTSGLLAKALRAATFLIGTNVERVAVNFGRPDQRWLERITAAEARRYLQEGQFPPGSMGPKVEAAVDFLEGVDRPDACAIICELERMAEALAGRTGTWIVKNG